MGITPPPEWIEARQEEEQDFEVLPEVWDSVQLFLLCDSQWRVDFGTWIGLDYGPIIMLGQSMGITNMTQTMQDIKVIETEILIQINKKQQKAVKK